MKRILKHPILNFPRRKIISFTFNGKELSGFEGDTIASALISYGIYNFHTSIKLKRPRGFFCVIGNCSSCLMEVDGMPNVRICVTLLREGMKIHTQEGKGIF